MAETQIAGETATSDFSGEVQTEVTASTDVTGDVTSDDQISTKYKNTDHESETSEDTGRKTTSDVVDKVRTRKMKSYPESWLKLKKRDKWKITTLLLRKCFPIGGFQPEHRARMTVPLGGCKRTRIWRSMRQPTRTLRKISRKDSERLWPSVWPCLTRDAAIGLEIREKEERKGRRDIFPCDPMDADEAELRLREQKSDFANRKELGHVRVPVSRSESKLKLSVERATGERPGLVNGDYVVAELPSGRVYAYVVLRGLKGMHLMEMSSLRERVGTWKFCFYQAIVALLAKTQLRYKYAWSANIDYIYDHAWMLYTHMGTINVKPKQRLDDIVVYNYRYSVEIELIEKKSYDVTIFTDIMHNEKGLRRQITLSRKDPLQVEVKLGSQKSPDFGHVPMHKDMTDLEEWLGEMIPRYSDCILRTTRFSLAFWQDGLFWYLYNPFRCNGHGFWDSYGRACIVKFCSADSLRRHLMILLMRGHVNTMKRSRLDDSSDIYIDGKVFMFVQLFRVSFRCCQLDNLKLLQRGAFKLPRRGDECPSDSLEEDETSREEDEEGDPREPRERATWLKRCRATTWGKPCANRTKPGSAEVTAAGKARWHQYYVEEPNMLFSLWGKIHITDDAFDEANRGMQMYACYMVCAGMTRITAPEYWDPKTLDAIVVCGDRYYTRSRREAELKSVSDKDTGTSRSSKYLSDRFDIGEILFEARMLPAVRGRLYAETDECLWKTLERVFSSYHFAVLTCESACLGLLKFCGAYYVCDVNSFGPPLFRYGHGVAYLLRATSIRKFVTVLVLIISSPERSRFSLNPVEILRIVEVDTSTCKSRTKTRDRKNRFGRFSGKVPDKLPRSVFDEQKKRKIKK